MKKAKLAIFFVSLAAIGCSKGYDIQVQFEIAITNAMETKKENIRDLVNITKDDPNTLWNVDGKVLMTTFHHHPDSYKEGKTITLYWESWVTSTKEFSNVYKKYKSSFENNPDLRVKQLLGLDYNSANTYITSYWVDPNDLIRPAYVVDTTKPMKITFDEGTSDEYKTWFYNQCGYAYYSDNRVPWTRLGYTYDYYPNKDRYGLSEFVISKDKEATVTVDKTKLVKDFLPYLETL